MVSKAAFPALQRSVRDNIVGSTLLNYLLHLVFKGGWHYSRRHDGWSFEREGSQHYIKETDKKRTVQRGEGLREAQQVNTIRRKKRERHIRGTFSSFFKFSQSLGQLRISLR